MTHEKMWLSGLCVAALAGSLLVACEDSKKPGPTATEPSVAGAGGEAGEDGNGGEAQNGGDGPGTGRRFGEHEAYEPAAIAEPPDPGGSGGRPAALIAPYGISTTCGDGILGVGGSVEECDDGSAGAAGAPDGCTDACQTRDQPIVPPNALGAERYLGNGRHPVAGNADRGFIATFVEAGMDEPAVGATLFDIWGKPQHRVVVSEGAMPLYDANPVAAELPDGDYAVAWTDLDGDGSDLGVALRRVKADGTLGGLGVANQGREFSQLEPDLLWTGTQLIAVWVDYADALTAPDLRYRVFDGNLSPQSGDLSLASSILPEAGVALAPFNGGWAAAYREGQFDGTELIVVKVGDESFEVGPVLGGPINDRPALTELDATHLLVTFSAGTDPGATGVYNVPRLRYAVIDTESSEPPALTSLDPLDDVYSTDDQVAQASPSAVKALDGAIYVAWRSKARPGDASGDQTWIKRLSWDPTLETKLAVGEAEVLIPRLCEGSFGDQRSPTLAPVGLPPFGALAIAWDDYSQSQGPAAGEPDVVVHYAPLHARRPEAPKLLIEKWSGPNGNPWPINWTSILTPHNGNPLTIQSNEGRVAW
jgi:hypothetical protein